MGIYSELAKKMRHFYTSEQFRYNTENSRWIIITKSTPYHSNECEMKGINCESQISWLICMHDDVIKWKHFPRYWPFAREIPTLHLRHNDHDGVSNHQPHDCLLIRLFRRRSKKTSKLRVTGLCAGNSPGTGEFPAQMASKAEKVSICWRHHENTGGFPSQRPVTCSFDVFFDLHLNKRLSKQPQTPMISGAIALIMTSL